MTKRKSTPKRVNKNQESYFDAERILDEKKVNGKWLYLIKWSGHDRNGKPWSPDWQPKDNCTQMLLKEWDQEKLRQRKRQEEQKNKENQKEKENREESNQDGNVVQEDRSADLQDDKADNKVQMDIDKPDNRIIEDNLKQVLDKYCCQNINDDIKRNSQTTIAKKELDPSRKIIKSLSFPASKVKLIKISPIQPTFVNNLPIKSSISIVESGNTVDVFNKSSNKHICGKSYSIPSKSGRVSLFNLNKRGLEDYNNNLTTIKRQRTEDVYDVIRKIQNEKVEESRNSTSSNVKNKKIPSSTNGSSNKISSDGNLTNSQTVPIYNVPSSQISNQVHVGAIHVNSETIRALNSRKNSYSSMISKLRPIASKSLQTTSSQHNGHNTGSSNSSNAVNVHSSSSTGKLSGSGSNASSSRQNSLSSKLASIKNPVSVAKIGASSGSSQVDKNVPTSTTSVHTSYFHKSYVQSTKYNKPYQTLQSVDNQNDQTMEKVSTPNKQPLTSATSERSNQQQQFSNLQSSNIGDSTMDDNPFYQLPLEKLKEPTVTNIDLWMNEWIKVKTLNDTLEKEKLDLIKEKNKYYREASQFKLEVEKRPQSDSEAAITIKRYHESIARMSNKWAESQSKYANKCNEFEKLESEYSKLRSEHNQVKKIVMSKHAEVETLKGDINEKIQKLKDLEEENNRLKSDWSRIVRNGVISMREDYQKITRLQNSFQDLINQRNKINIEINRMRETISQEINNMKEEDFDDDDEEYDNLYQQIENLKLQNKLQETSLRMAEENSKIAEESAKLMLDLKKLTVDETLKKYDVPSTFSFSNSQALSSSSSSSLANLLTKNNNTTSSNNNTAKQSQNRDNQSGNIRRMSGNAETRSVQSNSAQGHVNTNTNILQARNLTTVPTVRNNLGFGNQNISRSQTTVVKENSRRLSASSINPAHTVQSKDAAHSLGVRRSSTTTTVPMEMNVRPSTLTTEKFKVTRMTTNPIPKNPTKSTQQMNYFCEWNLCRRLFDDKIELKKHLKEDHFNSG